MKLDLVELKRALKYMEAKGTLTEVELSIDLHNRAILKYTDPMGGDVVVITMYDASTEKMADVTITSRLTNLIK